MIVYGTMKNYNKVIKEDTFVAVIDGIQLQLKKDLVEGYCEGADIYLDFAEEHYVNKYNLKQFMLKNASVQVDGDETDLDDNSDLVYNLIKNSVVKEFIISEGVLEDIKKICLLGSLIFDIGGRILHLKTNKVKFY